MSLFDFLIPVDKRIGNAIKNGRLNDVKSIVQKGQGLDTKVYNTPILLWAVGNSRMRNSRPEYMEIAKLLIEKGADVNGVSPTGITVLMEAVCTGDLGLVRMLLDRGADMGARNNQGWTALIAAARAGKHEVVEFLLSKGADMNARADGGTTALIEAAGSDSYKTLTLLIDRGANINDKDQLGMTSLMKAVQGEHIRNIRLLIKNGADVNVKNKNGQTALTGYRGKDRDIVDELRKAGADGCTAKEKEKERAIKQIKAVLASSGSKEVKNKKLLDIVRETNPGVQRIICCEKCGFPVRMRSSSKSYDEDIREFVTQECEMNSLGGMYVEYYCINCGNRIRSWSDAV